MVLLLTTGKAWVRVGPPNVFVAQGLKVGGRVLQVAWGSFVSDRKKTRPRHTTSLWVVYRVWVPVS